MDTTETAYESVKRRYPRLLRVMAWVAILTESEAVNGLAAYIYGFDGAGEAVTHFGGPEAVVKHAVKSRHIYRRLHESLDRGQPHYAN